MIYYKTKTYDIKIEPYEITRETAQTVFFFRENWKGEIEEKSERKFSIYHKFHKTFTDAKEHLLSLHENRIHDLSLKIDNLKIKLDEIKKL